MVTCIGPSETMQHDDGIMKKTIKVVVRVAKDDKTTFDCQLETESDRDAINAESICRSIRRKR